MRPSGVSAAAVNGMSNAKSNVGAIRMNICRFEAAIVKNL
jgi:hypothetical protein